ncbi:prepilin-type N-terminal cleavage/methylation domain-containing protein [Parelusimicrobium proximum]|uniref:type IV pilin protein n=1 Tax=Parelusimicrobium proximum TaxID=3228953 RepID=UPI003D183B35
MKRAMRSPRTFAKANILTAPQHLGGGFTLIELLVVVLIIAILAAVALPQYTRAVERSRVSEALITLKAAGDAVQRYYLQNDEYTGDFDNLDISFPGYTYSDGALNRTRLTGKYFSLIKESTTDYLVMAPHKSGCGLSVNDSACYIFMYEYSTGKIFCVDGKKEGSMKCNQVGFTNKSTCPWNPCYTM